MDNKEIQVNGDIEEILKTEYCEKFDEIRKNMMAMSFFKYGPLKTNYKTEKIIDAIKSLEKRLDKYKSTGNTELLCDIANFAMIEFMYPQHPNAEYISTDGGNYEIHGMGINQIKNWDKYDE